MSARLAQSVERQTLNLVVVGSSPTVGVFLPAKTYVIGKNLKNRVSFYFNFFYLTSQKLFQLNTFKKIKIIQIKSKVYLINSLTVLSYPTDCLASTEQLLLEKSKITLSYKSSNFITACLLPPYSTDTY